MIPEIMEMEPTSITITLPNITKIPCELSAEEVTVVAVVFN
jgi:hypothetical protein